MMEPLPLVAELQTMLEQHTEAVSCLTPYGPSHWLSCAWDGKAALWKTKPPFEVHEILPLESRPISCACEIGGKTIVRGDVDGVVEAWELVPIPPPPEPEAPPPPPPDPKAKKAPPAKAAPPPPPPEPLPEEWKVVRNLKPDHSRVTAVLHVHGKLIAAYASGSVFVYDTTAENWGPEPVGRLDHPTGVTALMHLEGNAVVSACTDRRIRVWDVSTLTCLATLMGHQSAVTCLAKTSDGRMLTGGGDGAVLVWRLIRPPAPDPPVEAPPEPEPPPPPPQGKHPAKGGKVAAHPPPHQAPPAPAPAPPPTAAAAGDGEGGERPASPAGPPPPPLGTEWEKEGEFRTGSVPLRAMLWSSGVLVCGDAESALTVWNHRPLRADEPDNKVWVRERSTLEGMGPGPVGPLAKIGKRMFAGGADGRIRVYM